MGREKKFRREQRQQEKLSNEIQRKPKSNKFSRILICIFSIGIFIIATGIFVWLNNSPKSTSSEKIKQDRNIQSQPLPQAVNETKSAFAKPVDVPKTVFMLPAELEKSPDAARLNLLCAKGLNGSEDLDIDKCLKTLDEWAVYVKHETDRNLHRFKENPEEYYNSEAYFRMGIMITVLQQDCGVKYNMKLSSLEKLDWQDAKDSKYVFLHGLLTGEHKGTCASMPVLYLAIGRRLGYPLKLVCARNHIFLRWEDDKERINIDGSGKGVSTHTDEYYRKWLKFTPEDNKCKFYLKSLNTTEEYALFLEFRADIMRYNGLHESAKNIYEKLLQYNPDNPLMKKRLREINGIEKAHALERIEHKKTDIRRKQFASIKLINQVQPRLELLQQKELIALNQEFFKKKNISWSTIEYAKDMDYQQNQMLFDHHVKSKMSMTERRVYQEEVELVKKLNFMLKTELYRWKNQIECGIGAPVTKEQINILFTKNSKPRHEAQKHYLEQQKNIKYKRIRKHSPALNNEIAYYDGVERKNRWLREELEIQERIRLANIQRNIAEANLDNLKNIKKVK